MRSIKATYNRVQVRSPYLGTYPCLVHAVKGRKFSRKSLVKAFKEIMKSEEYDRSEIIGLIDYLECLTNLSVAVEKQADFVHTAIKNS